MANVDIIASFLNKLSGGNEGVYYVNGKEIRDASSGVVMALWVDGSEIVLPPLDNSSRSMRQFRRMLKKMAESKGISVSDMKGK